jgi:hypothetical protein
MWFLQDLGNMTGIWRWSERRVFRQGVEYWCVIPLGSASLV